MEYGFKDGLYLNTAVMIVEQMNSLIGDQLNEDIPLCSYGSNIFGGLNRYLHSSPQPISQAVSTMCKNDPSGHSWCNLAQENLNLDIDEMLFSSAVVEE